MKFVIIITIISIDAHLNLWVCFCRFKKKSVDLENSDICIIQIVRFVLLNHNKSIMLYNKRKLRNDN